MSQSLKFSLSIPSHKFKGVVSCNKISAFGQKVLVLFNIIIVLFEEVKVLKKMKVIDCVIKHIKVEVSKIISTFKWSLRETHECKEEYKHSRYRWINREKDITLNGKEIMVHVAVMMYLSAFNLVKLAGKYY